ncbi:DUF2637 domain-containing protein [Spirillospora sp. NBC_00431]
MYMLVREYGEASWTATLLPVSVDGMIAVSSMTLLADSRQGRRSGFLPWALLVIGSTASLAANVAVAEPSLVGRLIAAWPSAALIGSYELLMRQVRHGAGPNTESSAAASGKAHATSPAWPRRLAGSMPSWRSSRGARPHLSLLIRHISGRFSSRADPAVYRPWITSTRSAVVSPPRSSTASRLSLGRVGGSLWSWLGAVVGVE